MLIEGGRARPVRRLRSRILITLLLVPGAGYSQSIHQLPLADRWLSGEPTDLFTVGTADGEPWEVFTDVRDVAFGPDGTLYVLDANARVLAFAPGGRFERQIAAAGRGPGEIDLPLSISVVEDGVVVGDGGGYHLFGFDGDFIRTIRPSAPAISREIVPVADALIVAGGFSASVQASRDGGGVPLYRQPMSEGAGTEVILRLDIPTVQTSTQPGSGGQATFSFTRPPPYSPRPLLAPISAEHVALATGTDWEVAILSDAGAVLAKLIRPILGRPSNREDLDLLQRRAAEAGVRTFGGPPPGAALPRGGPRIADVIPVIRVLRGNGEGLLFVARETNPVGGARPTIDIVSADGVYVGSLREHAMPLALGPDRRAAFVETDDLGVDRIVVRRLPREWFGK